MPDGPPTSPLSPDHVLDWPGRTATADAVLAAVERRVQRRRQLRRRAAAAVASLTLLVVAGTTWFRPTSFSPATALATRATVTQPTRQRLTDGSQIELNGDARVLVEFSPAVRRVTIVRGEAHFEVAHDTARPFVVVAGEVSVRAVGTAFSVRLAPRDVNVLVTDGRVRGDSANGGVHIRSNVVVQFFILTRKPSRLHDLVRHARVRGTNGVASLRGSFIEAKA